MDSQDAARKWLSAVPMRFARRWRLSGSASTKRAKACEPSCARSFRSRPSPLRSSGSSRPGWASGPESGWSAGSADTWRRVALN